MSALAHVPGTAWASTHRALVLALLTTFVVVAAVLTVVLVTGDSVAAPPSLPSYEDGCSGALPGDAC